MNQTNIYDGLGKRVRVVDSAPRDFIYDLAGNMISEDDGESATDYVYLNGIPVMKVEEDVPTSTLCWDYEISAPCNTNLWDKGGIGYDYTFISRDSTHVISGQYSEKVIAEDYGTVNSGFLALTKQQIETTHRYLDLWVYSDTAQNTAVKVEVRYGSDCGQTELVTVLPYTDAVAGWNHVSADLLSIVNYIEQTYGAYLDLQIRVYNWHGNTIWVDKVDIHQYLIGENGYFIHSDHLGTPQVMSDSGKAVVWQADYLPFGDIYQTTGTATLNFRFPGQYQDRASVYQNGFRDYNPKVGRYLTPDPIGLTGGINPYVYVDNNSINNFDPFGLSGKKPPTPPILPPSLNDKDCPPHYFYSFYAGSTSVQVGIPLVKVEEKKNPKSKCKITKICFYKGTFAYDLDFGEAVTNLRTLETQITLEIDKGNCCGQ